MTKPTQVALIPEGELEICQFSGRPIRKVLHNNEWFFSVVDVIGAMTDSTDPSRYWSELKKKLVVQEGFSQLFDKIEQLKMAAKDGKERVTDGATTEIVFRILQSVPSPKAEPFKRWLAKVGYERIQEQQNPTIAIKRAIVDYQMQGRPMEWIEARLRTLASRKELTTHWKNAGINTGLEFAILTDEISRGTFGVATKAHKEHKSLGKNHDLRDNMTSMELILTMLGETATKQIAQAKKALGFGPNRMAASEGGSIAGKARIELEAKTGQKVLSSENNLKSLPDAGNTLNLPDDFDETLDRLTRVPPMPADD